MMNRIAKKRRQDSVENGGEELNIWGPLELIPFKDRFSVKKILTTWMRPFKLLFTEPIVLVLSLMSGIPDALIFMFTQSFWWYYYIGYELQPFQFGLTFLAISFGYIIAWAVFIPVIWRNQKERRDRPSDERSQYESRLWFLLYIVPCMPIGLFGFAWTTNYAIHWIVSMAFAAIAGIANYAIYVATTDYIICAYGPYSASAIGGNGWVRNFLAGILTITATPFFKNIGLKYAYTILACTSFVPVVAVYVVYWKGSVLRKRSPFAEQLARAR
jgi:MFS family permease